MNQFLRLPAYSLTYAVLFVGLGRLASAAPGDSLPAAPAAAATKEITLDDARKWAIALQHAVSVQDVDAFNKAVDWDAFVATATALPGNSTQLKEFRANFERGLKAATASPSTGFGRAIIGAIDGPGEYRPLHTHREAGRVRVLFRLISSNGALNYHDWVLGRSKDGNVAAADCYVFLIGEMYSQNLRRSFLPLAHQQGGASLDSLSGEEKDLVAHINEVSQMGLYVRQKDWRQAMNVYAQLPPTVQQSTPALTMRLLATQSISNADYLATIDAFRKSHPKDAMIDLISIDAHLIRKDYAKALEAIDRVDKSVGGDPYLNVLRGSILEREQKLDAARAILEKSVAQEPSLLRGYYALIDLSLERHNYGDTVKWLKQAEAKGVKFGDMRNAATFGDFVKSPEYKSWAKSHGQ
jgi:tetratricopeptide (TPR) repeat protein